jgi:hypothetical protein
MRALLTLSALCAACAAPMYEPEPGEAWVPVHGFAGGDFIEGDHLTNLMATHGVPAFYLGSVIYGLSVPRSCAQRSRALIAADGGAVRGEERVRALGLPYADARDGTDAATPEGAALRAVDPLDVQEAPTVAELRVTSRRYADRRARKRPAYDVVVVLERADGEGEIRRRFQWVDGALVGLTREIPAASGAAPGLSFDVE